MKYKLSSETKTLPDGTVLYRIISCKTLLIVLEDGHYRKVNKGDLGGWVQSLKNLSQNGSCWILDNAIVCGSALVGGNAIIKDNAIVKSKAHVYGDAIISQHAQICDRAKVFEKARVSGTARVSGDVCIFSTGNVANQAVIKDSALIRGKVSCSAKVGGCCIIDGCVRDSANLKGKVIIQKNSTIYGKTVIDGNVGIESSKIGCSTSSNLCANHFNSQKVSVCIKNESFTSLPEKIRVSPVNFLRKTGSATLTEGSSCISCSDTTRHSHIMLSKSQESLIARIKFLEPDFESLSSDYWFFPQIYNFIIKSYDSTDFLAQNFFTALKTLPHNDKIFDGIFLEKIEENKNKIISFSKTYIFSQFVGVLFWCSAPFTDCGESEEKRWRSFLENFLNVSVLDFKNSQIIEIGKDVFAWNKEMLNMVSEICEFSASWKEKACKAFHEIAKTSLSLELYCLE